jgi:hypothetical protein
LSHAQEEMGYVPNKEKSTYQVSKRDKTRVVSLKAAHNTAIQV